MSYLIRAIPPLDVAIQQPKEEDRFPVFQETDMVKVYQKSQLSIDTTRLSLFSPRQHYAKRQIIAQEHKGYPLSAANACIQMLAAEHLPEHAIKTLVLPKEVLVSVPQTDETTLHALNQHIYSSLKSMRLRVITNTLPKVNETDNRLAFLGQLIQQNGPCIVAVVNHSEKQFKTFTTHHFVMVDWIADYQTEGRGTILAAEIRDPSSKGHFCVPAATLLKANVVGSKIFQVPKSTTSPESPRTHMALQTPSTQKFHLNRPPSMLLMDSPTPTPPSSKDKMTPPLNDGLSNLIIDTTTTRSSSSTPHSQSPLGSIAE